MVESETKASWCAKAVFFVTQLLKCFKFLKPRHIFVKSHEMAACAQNWPTKEAPELLFYTSKDVPKDDKTKSTYMDVFSPYLKKQRSEDTKLKSDGARNKKASCSIRFNCKTCNKYCSLKLEYHACSAGKDLRKCWKLQV